MSSTAARIVRSTPRQVKPIRSSTPEEARKAVLATYRVWMKRSADIWYRELLMGYPLPVFRQAIKDRFLAKAHLGDLRAIDRLVYQSEMSLVEMDWKALNVEHFENRLMKTHLRKQPADFLSKFFAGKA